MQALIGLALAASLTESDPPRTYLASIELPVGPDESVSEFRLDTAWVQFEAICHIPDGWFIEAGADATLKGFLKGEGSHGATWLDKKGLEKLQSLVLITMWGPVQKQDEGLALPATFKGYAIIGDGEERRPLSYRNIKLTPATECPSWRKEKSSR